MYILLPLLAGALYLALSLPRLVNSLYYGLPSSAPVILPLLAVCIAIVLLFHYLSHLFGLKIASLATFATSLVLGLASLLTAPDGHLADLLESIYLASDSSETVVIPDDSLYRESQKYPSPTAPLLRTPPDNPTDEPLDHFWLITYLPDDLPSSPFENYEITDEISTPYYLALKLQKV